MLGIGAVAATVAEAVSEPHRISFERVDVPIQGLDPAFDGYRIAVVSDWHLPRRITAERLREIFQQAFEFQPDLVVAPGDLCDEKGGGPVPDFAGVFDGRSCPDGFYTVLGNHDHWWDAGRLRLNLAKATPFLLLDQKHIQLRRRGASIALGGVGDLWTDVCDPVATFRGVPDDVPRILLSHNPDVAEDRVWPVRVDLQISGHTHGGEVCWWPGRALKVPSKHGGKFRAGLVEGRSHRVYVSRGITSPRGVRFLCPPEVTWMTLRASA